MLFSYYFLLISLLHGVLLKFWPKAEEMNCDHLTTLFIVLDRVGPTFCLRIRLKEEAIFSVRVCAVAMAYLGRTFESVGETPDVRT